MVPASSAICRSVLAVTALFALQSGHAQAQAATKEMPSLGLHFTVKRDSMKTHGRSEFDVQAMPVQVAGTNDVYYNAAATFFEDGVTYVYSLVDGVAYYSTRDAGGKETVACLDSNSLPAVKSIVQAMNAASAVTSVPSEEAIECSNGQLAQTKLGGEPYVICAASGAGFKVFSADYDVQVNYLPSAATITKPSVNAENSAACTAQAELAATVSPSTMSLLTGVGKPSFKRSFRPAAAGPLLPKATCGCKGAKRPCIFFHGLGVKKEQGVVDTFDYFGKIKDSAPCCSSVKYGVLNTVDNEWYQDALQQKVCDMSLQQSNTSSTASKVISDTIIVTHSMGNLMLAGALATGKCSLAPSTDWVGLSGPMKGSMASDYLDDACNSNAGGFVNLLAKILGRCPANLSTKALLYETGKKASALLKEKYAAAQAAYANSVTAVMCSDDASGISDRLTFRTASNLVPHKSKQNDGVVEYESCAAGIPPTKFAPDYNSRFYVTQCNHMDTAFRHGDAISNNAQKPVKWFECLL